LIDFRVFQDTGPVVGGRGTPIEVMDFNMKDSAEYTVAYFPTDETASAPLVRPYVQGQQTLSYKVFTFFELSGDYNWIKNLRFRVTVQTPPEASDAVLYYKLTNSYEAPNKNPDAGMQLLADKNGMILKDPIYPLLSVDGPNQAYNRLIAYNNVRPLYTNYFVTQMRVNAMSLVGNTAEFKLKFEAYEYYIEV
jgi:hypothetical protein